MRQSFFEKRLGAFRYAAAQFSGGPVVIYFAARRVRSFLIDASFTKSQRIGVDRVAAAMLDVHRMAWNSGVQIGNAQWPAVFGLGVVILETENPFTGRSLCSAFAQRRLN